MRYEIKLSARFKRDLKTCRKRGYDMDKLNAVVELLSQGATLPLKNRDRDLEGNCEGFRECHITPDWLLVYRHDKDVLVLYLFRSGMHSDLF
ncbi:hypothetical protein FACS1894133_7760 [Clostridia bacterium]|nr:hypothetical protein FACS1894133_7760 [Clostridia bacterium]